MDGQLPYLQIIIEVLENLPDNKARGKLAVFPSFSRKTAEWRILLVTTTTHPPLTRHLQRHYNADDA